jgi:hypothetical protein
LPALSSPIDISKIAAFSGPVSLIAGFGAGAAMPSPLDGNFIKI